jgi:hypothetical protein
LLNIICEDFCQLSQHDMREASMPQCARRSPAIFGFRDLPADPRGFRRFDCVDDLRKQKFHSTVIKEYHPPVQLAYRE